jgi:hypothetical protein
MIRRAITVLLLMAAPAAPAAAQPRVQPDLAANAAMKYWQAFAHLPPRDEAQQEWLRDWRTTPIVEAARKLVADSDKSFLYLRRGAALPRCDWSLNFEDGNLLLMPHLDKARTLSLLACLKARIALLDGHPAEAVDDLLATLTMGRQCADPIMICVLVDQNIEHQAIDALALLLPKLDPATVKRISDYLAKLPPAATMEQTLITERDYFIGWAIRQLKEWQKAGVKDMRARVRVWLGKTEDDVELNKLLDDDSAIRLIKALEALGPFFDEKIRLAGLPPEQFNAQWPELEKKRLANPIAKLMLPALVRVVHMRDNYVARLAMLKAALAVTQDGKDALAKHPDPFGKGPFEFIARPHGFELRSALKHENSPPAVLIVGPPD